VELFILTILKDKAGPLKKSRAGLMCKLWSLLL